MILLTLFAALSVQTHEGHVGAFDRAAGWRSLFDGESLAGWHTPGTEGVRADGWRVEDGCLHLPAGAGGGDLVTTSAFDDFELEFEWRVAPGGNSGVKYRVEAGAGSMVGPEYQLLDDDGHSDGSNPKHAAAALYDLLPAEDKELRPAGEFNRARIVARGDRIEHWLNGVRVLECPTAGARWDALLASSKFKGVEGFGRGPGAIGLQDHGDAVWVRRLRVREFEHLPGEEVRLFDGETLTGWREVGDARWSVEDGAILGEVGGGGQSFLVSEREFADFVLEVDLKPELPGNSGIQVRSHQDERGRVFGYQIEIDSSDRAWSGGLYDEARRAWLDDLTAEPAARAAFRRGAWNRYRIECVGPRVRTWVNGVPAADWLDPVDLQGFFALQVHSGNDTRVRWRDLRLQDLGRHAWQPTSWLDLRFEDRRRPELGARAWSDVALRFEIPRKAAIERATQPDMILIRGSSTELDERIRTRECLRRIGGGWGVLVPSDDYSSEGDPDEPLRITLLASGGRCSVFEGDRLLATDLWPEAPDAGLVWLTKVIGPGGTASIRGRDVKVLPYANLERLAPIER